MSLVAVTVRSSSEQFRRQLETSGDRGHLLLNLLFHLVDRIAECGENQVFEHLEIIRVHRFRRYSHIGDDKLSGDADFDHVTAGRSDRGEFLHPPLGFVHSALELLRILHYFHWIHMPPVPLIY